MGKTFELTKENPLTFIDDLDQLVVKMATLGLECCHALGIVVRKASPAIIVDKECQHMGFIDLFREGHFPVENQLKFNNKLNLKRK